MAGRSRNRQRNEKRDEKYANVRWMIHVAYTLTLRGIGVPRWRVGRHCVSAMFFQVHGRGRSLVPLKQTRDFGMTPQESFAMKTKLRRDAITIV